MPTKAHRIQVRALKSGGDNRFSIRLTAAGKRAGTATNEQRDDAGDLAALARDLNLSEVRKLAFEGEIRPAGQEDWRLTAHLGATIVQPCVITAEAVTTRLDFKVERLFVATPPDLPPTTETGSDEVQFDGDDTWDALESAIDLWAVMAESLALEIPEYPRAGGATLGQATFAPPGAAPLTPENAKPFASLAALRNKLKE